MHSLCSRALAAAASRCAGPSRLARPTLAGAASAAAAVAPAMARASSSLPVITDYVRRSYPFPTILESALPYDASRWLWYHQQHPHDRPHFRSALTVDLRDLGLDATSRMVLREIVGQRFDPRTHRITFVSRNLATAQANENRVFQMLDASLSECRRIARQMNAEGAYAKERGSEPDRLLKPVPDKVKLIEKKLRDRAEKMERHRQLKRARKLILLGKKPAELTASAAAEQPKKAKRSPNARPKGLSLRKKDLWAIGVDVTKKYKKPTKASADAAAASATPAPAAPAPSASA